MAGYYTGKLEAHGATPLGVDWKDADSQRLRFEVLAKLFNASGPFSVNDLGCGYGALVDFLAERAHAFRYFGWDVSQLMIETAQQRFASMPHATFACSALPDAAADYTVASGIFNVRLDIPESEWTRYVLETIEVLDAYSTKGFGFNCLTGYADEPMKRADLYYADPCQLFDLCKRRYSKYVTLHHDYPLYEFTILVRKQF